MEKKLLAHLLHRIAEHDDEKAFSSFFDYYHPKLVRLALIFIPSFEQSQDIVSEVFIKLLRNRNAFNKIENFEGYLYRAVKNQCLNFINTQKKHHTHLHIDDLKDHLSTDHIDPMEKILESELRTIVTDVVDSLPPKRQMVYRMIKDDKMTYLKVGEILGIAERTVESHLKLALRDLHQALDEHYKERNKSVPLRKWANMILLFI